MDAKPKIVDLEPPRKVDYRDKSQHAAQHRAAQKRHREGELLALIIDHAECFLEAAKELRKSLEAKP